MSNTPGDQKSLPIFYFSGSSGRWLAAVSGSTGSSSIQLSNLTIDLCLQIFPDSYINAVLEEVRSDSGKQAIQLLRLSFRGQADAHQHALKCIALDLPALFSMLYRLQLMKIFFFPGLIRCHM